MLDEVLSARPVLQDSGLQRAGRVELVVAREDDPRDLLLVVPLGDEVAAEDLQPAVTLPNALPEVGGAMAAIRVDRIPLRAVVPLVEREEPCAGALEPS